MENKNKIKLCFATRFCMKITFLWPFGDELNGSTFFLWSEITYFLLLGSTVLLLEYSYLYFTVKEKYGATLESLGVCLSNTGVATITVLFAFNRKKIAKVMIHLSNFEQFGQPKSFTQVNQILNRISWALNCYGWFCCIIYTMFRSYKLQECKMERIKHFCGVAIPVYAPFDYASHEYLAMLYFFFFEQAIARSVLLIPLVLIELVINIKIRVEHLNGLILEALKDYSSITHKKIYNCILYHNDIIRTCDEVNECFSHSMFAYLMVAGVTCGCLESQLIQYSDIITAVHLFLWLGALFPACLAGQILMDATTSTAIAIYNSKWYNADIGTKKNISIMLIRAQKPQLLQTGAFNNLSFELFVWMMRTSYSIYALLR